MASGGPGPPGADPLLRPTPAGDTPTPAWLWPKEGASPDEAPWDPPAPDCPGWDGVPGPQPTFPHPQTSPLGGQPPASVPPWQSRGVGEAERETERGVRDRRTDGDGGEGRRRVGRHSHQSMADGATATAHRRKLLGPRATASPRPTPLTRSVPRGSSQGRSQSRTGTLDPSVPPGPLRPGRSPRLTSPPQRPRRSPRAGERDEQG